MVRSAFHAFALLTTVLLSWGCDGQATINTRAGDEEAKASIQRVKDSLPEGRRGEFEEAMKVLVFSDVSDFSDLADGDGVVRRFQEKVDGMTGEEVVAAAEQVKAERELKAQKQAIVEIQEIAQKLDPAAEEMCAHFVVQRSDYKREGGGFLGGPRLELSILNDTGHTVSRAYFIAVLLTPGRELPWATGEFSYQVPGGLERGESAVWSFRPDSFRGWAGTPREREDLICIVRTIGLEGSDGEPLGGQMFTSRDEDRLGALLESFDYEGADGIRASLASRSEMLDRWKRSATERGVRFELSELRERKAEADAAATELALFKIPRSRFYRRESRFSEDPIIELDILNGTSHPITSFSALGVLSSPGRESPWLEETFSYSIPGALEPGETRHLELAPNSFGKWGRAPKDQDDMVLTVTINSLEGQESEQLFAVEWEPGDLSRLEALAGIAKAQGWE